jgi:hypothetical protein
MYLIIFSILGVIQPFLVKNNVANFIFSVNVKKEYEFIGGNSVFILEGEGTCKIKSTSNPLIIDSPDGKIQIDLNPNSEYQADVIV